MKQSLPGVLDRAAERLEHTRDAKYLAHPLQTLLANLRELRDRRDDPSVLKEFFGIYVFGDGKDAP